MRKYEYETGRFISIDPLWSNYFGWTPYQYTRNNPISRVDITGALTGLSIISPVGRAIISKVDDAVVWIKGLIKGSDNVVSKIDDISKPEGWVTTTSEKGGGFKHYDPKNPHNNIREMPGSPKSPNPAQQKPYVVYKKDGIVYDKNGIAVKNSKDRAGHIPRDEFDINKMPKFD